MAPGAIRFGETRPRPSRLIGADRPYLGENIFGFLRQYLRVARLGRLAIRGLRFYLVEFQLPRLEQTGGLEDYYRRTGHRSSTICLTLSGARSLRERVKLRGYLKPATFTYLEEEMLDRRGAEGTILGDRFQ